MAKAPSHPPPRDPSSHRWGRSPFVAAALTLMSAVCLGTPASAQTREAGSVRLAQGATDAPPAQSRPTPPDPSLFDACEAFARAAADKTDIRFGLTAPFTGPNKEFGRQLTLGVETAFNAVNDAGGVGTHRLKLITADDGYEPSRTTDLVKRLAEKDGVAGFVASFGTPTVAATLPYILERKLLLLGALTGSNVLRSVPPDRYVFNYRPSYAE